MDTSKISKCPQTLEVVSLTKSSEEIKSV